MSQQTVLDDVADEASNIVYTRKREAVVWVTAGTADVSMNGGATMVSLTVGDFKLLTVGSGTSLTFTATSADTTAKIKHVIED